MTGCFLFHRRASHPPPLPSLFTRRYDDIGHSNGAKKILEKHRVGVLNAADAAATASEARAERSAGGFAPYVLAVLALAAALAYQFVYVPRYAGK